MASDKAVVFKLVEGSNPADKITFKRGTLRLTKSKEWILKNYKRAIHEYKLEEYFQNSDDEVLGLIAELDKKLGLDKAKGYKLRSLRRKSNDKDSFYRNL